MARRSGDGLFVVAALGVAALAFVFLRPQGTGASPATDQTGMVGGGVPGSPNQVLSHEGAQAAAREIAAFGI